MLYIMRHGKTEWNELHKLQGRTDIPLNNEGKQMAKNAGEKYKDINFDVCYCSPLIRAKETAKLVLEGRNVPIIYDDRLREMSFGIYEGMENPAKATDSPIRTFFKEPDGAMNSSIVCQIRNLPLSKFWDAGIENCKLMKLK